MVFLFFQIKCGAGSKVGKNVLASFINGNETHFLPENVCCSWAYGVKKKKKRSSVNFQLRFELKLQLMFPKE